MEPLIWTIFWVLAGIGAIGAVVAAISMIRTGGDNYSKNA